MGSGRSGTTWVAELLNYDAVFREVFEPFHPFRHKKAKWLRLNQYVRNEDDHPQLYGFSKAVFSGNIYGQKIDLEREYKLFSGLLVKDVFASLFAFWVSKRFPSVKIILLIRNPFAVALSTYKTRDWIWMTNPLDFLQQPELVEDYLKDKVSLIQEISETGDFITKQILIWSIVNYVILRQFGRDGVPVVFYESLLNSPESEVSKLMRVGRGFGVTAEDLAKLLKLAHRPSKMIGKKSTIEAGSSPISSWKSYLSESQVVSGSRILKHFHLDKLYDNDGMPITEGLTAFFNMVESQGGY